MPGLPLSYTPDVAKLSHGAGVLEIFAIFLWEVGAGRRGRRPLQAGSKVDACPRRDGGIPPYE